MIQMIKVVSSILLFCVLSACSTLMTPAENKETKIAEINIQMGMTYLKRGKIQFARHKFEAALAKNPKLPEAWYSMGYFLEKTGHKKEAKQYYLNALVLAPNRGDVQNNYGTYLCRSGSYQEAIDHFLMATKDVQYADVASAYENAGLCALKIPDLNQAKDYFNSALQKNPARRVSKSQWLKLNKKHR